MKTTPTMIKKTLAALFLLCTLSARAQYNNEWIDYNKTYYKFKVGSSGLYRIPQSTLQSAGLGAVPAEQFQLWRNGEQVSLYTTTATGPLGGSDYIEFYGRMNDGKPDTKLYRDPSLQLSDYWSLETDTASFFLTVDPVAANARVGQDANNVAGNLLPPDPYFIYKKSVNFKARINPGFAAVVGEYIYSSSYDMGEGWASPDVYTYSPIVDMYTNLYVAPGGPAPNLGLAVSGNALNTRSVQAFVNGTQVISQPMNYFNGLSTAVTLPAGLIGQPTDTIRIVDASAVTTDRIAVSKYELTYPRLFNFGGSRQFEFNLPANPAGNYLEISNFNYGAQAPVLYDNTNGKRYVGDLSVPGLVRFALPPSGDRNLVLLSQESTAVGVVFQLNRRDFVDYRLPANQGDFMIISNKSLYSGNYGNPVENYRLYRASPQGGGHHARIYDIDQLVDQFAFGIRQHPLSIKNFIRFARYTFADKPKNVFLIGKGIMYNDMRIYESKPGTALIDIVPTFGNPGSDNVLAADGYDAVPAIPIGRLSVTSGSEVEVYLAKVKQYEAAINNNPQTKEGRAWMKDIVHAIGGNDIYLQTVIQGYMNVNRDIIEDTLFGGNVKSFTKINSGSVQPITAEELKSLFASGLGMVTYFGHSSATILEFNLDDPYAYDNAGKYPVFIVNGCNAGNYFVYDTARTVGKYTILSEKYVLADQRGGISFIASSHYGIVNYLNIFTNSFYTAMAYENYGGTVGDIHKAAIAKMGDIAGFTDFFNRMHMEELIMHGDPALPMNTPKKPDYAIEQTDIKVSPNISVAENTFRVIAKFFNLGKAVGDSIRIRVTRQLPSGSTLTIYDKLSAPLRYSDSLALTIPINPLTDKGSNRITVTLDPNDSIPEISEANNSSSADVFIYEDEVRPVYPYPLSIVNKNAIHFLANSANPISTVRSYVLEVDTTELFNSAYKKTLTVSSTGGLIEFNPGLSFSDSMVYYWRVAPVPQTGNTYKWSEASFIYLPSSGPGWNNSHYYQYLKNDIKQMKFSDQRHLDYDTKQNQFRATVRIYPYGNQILYINEELLYSGGCGAYLNSLEFVLINARSGKAIVNKLNGTEGDYHSLYPVCPSNGLQTKYPRWYFYNDPKYRKYAMDFLDSLPNETIVYMSNYGSTTFNSNPVYVDGWKADTTLYGSGNSLYHKLMSIGLTKIDSFYTNRPMLFVFKKTATGAWEVLDQSVGALASDQVVVTQPYESKLSSATVVTSVIGPSKNWKSVDWGGFQQESADGDALQVNIVGIKKDFTEAKLYSGSSLSKDTSISFIDAASYPYLRLELTDQDTVNYTPYQFKYLQVKYDPVPEGALAPNLFFQAKDSVDVGEPMTLRVAFKNVTEAAFDSMKVKYSITDQGNVKKDYVLPKLRPMAGGDSLVVTIPVETKGLPGKNTLYLDINPDNDQLEQYHFNNFLFKDFYVRSDNYKPNLDITFDGIHILNRDIISAKPHVLIKLEDNNKYMQLNDTNLLKVQVRYPDNSLHTVNFDNVLMRFTPASGAVGSARNVAEIDYTPTFEEDGEYELLVSGRDKSGNSAGDLAYKVVFQVINKPMISNLLNYPNPFTSSTAFVFTLTGSEVPREFKIQIMTVTGKIVREITREELGNIRIGRNITDFKWDGTDQYGQKLGNGTYLYRVVTSLHGKSMEKYHADGDLTDQYFNKGYGKMYLMR